MADKDFKIETFDLQALRAKTEEAVTYLDAKLATELQEYMEKLLAGYPVPEELREEFNIALAKMKFLRFLSIGDNDLLDLISNYLILAFDLPEFDLKDKIGKRIFFMGDIEDQVAFMEKLAMAFEHCKQSLGLKPVAIGDKEYQPSVENWLKAYLNVPTKNALRQNIDELSFIEKGQPAKSLGKSEREKLLNILGIYDSLKNRVSQYRSLPESDDEKEVFKDFDLYSFLPGMTAGREEETTPDQAGGTVYMEANTYRLPENLQAISAGSADNRAAPVSQQLTREAPQGLTPGTPLRPVAPKPAFDIKPQQIRDDIEEKKRLAQQQIDQKLQELKKKSQSL